MLIDTHLGACVMIMQVLGELLAQALVALAAVTGDDGVLEQSLLHVARQLCPEMHDGAAERQRVPVVATAIGVFRHVTLPGGPCRLSALRRSGSPRAHLLRAR